VGGGWQNPPMESPVPNWGFQIPVTDIPRKKRTRPAPHLKMKYGNNAWKYGGQYKPHTGRIGHVWALSLSYVTSYQHLGRHRRIGTSDMVTEADGVDQTSTGKITQLYPSD